MKAQPTKKQLEYLSWEFGVFFHFGIRTFYEGVRDWDGQVMTPDAFAPTALDCRQWIRTIQEAGAKYAILTCKHHDGFANWPTKFSDYSVASAPWKEGKGDVVREFTDACRAYGVKIGLYYSPAEPSMQGKTAQEYDDYFFSQVSELLSNYGQIDYLWFDGCGSGDHKYDTRRIVGQIRKLQPGILLFGMWDPDVRWVGNEAGYAPETNYQTETMVDYTGFDFDRKNWFNVPAFIPSECDCMMRRRNWFYQDQDQDTVKSLEELMGLYYGSVGRGSNLLINIGPDRRGLLPERDANALLSMGAEVRSRFDSPIARLDRPEIENSAFSLKLPEPQLIDTLVLQEDLTEGEGVKAFQVKVSSYPTGTVYDVYNGKSMGHKKIVSFPAVYTDQLHVEITETFGAPIVAAANAYHVGPCR